MAVPVANIHILSTLGISSNIRKPLPVGPTFICAPLSSFWSAVESGPFGTDTE